jgi:general L-amino acid transport system permease protein
MSDLRSETSVAYVRTETVPPSAPPANTSGLQGWMRENLFPNPLQSVLTIIMGGLALYILWLVLEFAVFNAVFTGENGEACRGEGRQDGACWAMAKARFGQWIYGFYPVCRTLAGEHRVPAGRTCAGADADPVAAVQEVQRHLPARHLSDHHADPADRRQLRHHRFYLAHHLRVRGGHRAADPVPRLRGEDYLAVLAAISSAAIAGIAALLLFIFSIDFGLEYVETSQWGGLLVTLVVAVTGIVASLPIGILLALGRRSHMPVVKLFSVAFIELWRGVPLITVLFMASVVLPLFLPPGTNFDKLLRALVGVALFSSAYMAEVVRGGLQAIPKGQTEAAQALGLTFWQNMGLITLPQALKLVIPGIVNTFIGLFKDTTLVGIIGLYDLLLIIQTANTDANWAAPQTHSTGLLAAAAIFWIFCFAMSRYSMFMERKLDTGHKR